MKKYSNVVLHISDFRIFRDRMVRIGVVAALMILVLALIATAAVAADGPQVPDSGTALEGSKPPGQASKSEVAPIQINEPTPAATGDTRQIRVNGFRFSGELPVAEADLQQVAAPQVGKDLTLDDLNHLAAELTHYLRERGFLVASVYVPAQTIRDGVVELKVVPGKFGAVTIDNQARIDGGRLEKMAAALKTGDIVTKAKLERVLLLMNDLPGVDVKAGLAPGQTSGSTDLTLMAIDTAKINASLYADNWGNHYTGTYRGGFNAGLANPGHYGDNLQIGGQTAGSGLNSFSLGYNLPFLYDGARLAFNYSKVNYSLGEDFADLDAGGYASVAGLSLSYPFIRSRSANLYGSFGYDCKDLYDEIRATDTETPRSDGLFKLGINGNYSDNWHGADSFALTYSRGHLKFSDDTAADTDSASSQTAGDFNKLVFNFRRQQQLSSKFGLDIQLSSQFSDHNLDSSEKFYLGGADGVRAYPQGEAACDDGSLLTVELKYLVTQWSNDKNHIYLASFYDYGYGKLNHELWSGADEDNSRILADAGLGLIWARRNFNLRLDYALKLSAQEAEADKERDGRFWMQCVQYF